MKPLDAQSDQPITTQSELGHAPNRINLVFVPSGNIEFQQVRCEGASELQLRALTETAAKWHTIPNRHRRMREVGPAIGLERLVFIFDSKRDPLNETHLTSPIPGPFEPFELREGVPKLYEVLDQVAEQSKNCSQVRRAGVLRIAWTRWAWVQPLLVFGLGLMLPFLTSSFPSNRALIIAGGAILILTSFITMLVPPNIGNWFLIPGGIAQRRKGPLAKPGGILSYTSATSALIIERIPASWLVTITGKDATLHIHMTRLEAIALLAAWRCPAPPPSNEALSKLI